MTLRIVLVALVSALGLTLPTRSELPGWCQSAELWASKQLADWDACERSPVATGVAADMAMVRVAHWEMPPVDLLRSATPKESVVKVSAGVVAKAVPAPPAKIAALLVTPSAARVAPIAPVASKRPVSLRELLAMAWPVLDRQGKQASRWIVARSHTRVMAMSEHGELEKRQAMPPHSSAGLKAVVDRVVPSENVDLAVFAELCERIELQKAGASAAVPPEGTMNATSSQPETDRPVRHEPVRRRVAVRAHLRGSKWTVTQRLASVDAPRNVAHAGRLECAPRVAGVAVRALQQSSVGDLGMIPRSPNLATAQLLPSGAADERREHKPVVAIQTAPLVNLPDEVFAPEPAALTSLASSSRVEPASATRAIAQAEPSQLGHAVDLTHQAIHAWMAVLVNRGALQMTSR